MNKIVIIISGGAVQAVVKPKGIALEIRDYDVEGDDVPENNEHFQRDDSGDWYQRMFWSEDQVEGYPVSTLSPTGKWSSKSNQPSKHQIAHLNHTANSYHNTTNNCSYWS